VTTAVVAIGLSVMAITSAWAAVKPKPWQWQPEKVVVRLTLRSRSSAATLDRTSCPHAALLRGEASRAGSRGSSCATRWGSSMRRSEGRAA
jgi:hypothetical protein